MDLIPGKRITLGRTVYTVPAMSARLFVRYRAVLAAMSNLAGRDPSDEEMGALVEMIHAVLQRNHPDLHVDTVWDNLDLRTLPDVIKAITGQSELEPQPGE